MYIRRPLGAWDVWHPQDCGRSVKPISTRGHIMPTTLELTPRIFRPSYGPVFELRRQMLSLIRFYAHPYFESQFMIFFHENQIIKLGNDQTTIKNIWFLAFMLEVFISKKRKSINRTKCFIFLRW